MIKTVAILLALAVMTACKKPEAPANQDVVTEQPEPGYYSLPLIQTTDMHGYMVVKDNGTTHYRLGYIARKAGDLRQGGDLLLVDSGDIYQGASVSNMLAGRPVYTALDRMHYDAVALGNHEFDWGWGNLVDPDATLPDYSWKGTDCQNKVPVVCANIYQYGSRLSTTRDYVIVQKEATGEGGGSVKVKIGIVGFATDYSGSIMTSKFTDMGYSIREDYSIAEDIAARLEAGGQCDATVLLVHGPAPTVAARLSRDSAIDLVLGGHSHRYEKGVTEAGMPYLQGGRNAERYALAELSFYLDENGTLSFRKVEGQQIMTVDAAKDCVADEVDPQIKEVSDDALDAISAQLNTVIGHIGVGATTYAINGSGGRSTTMGNWMCDITRRIGEADVAFVNSGGIRATLPLNGQPAQDVTVAKVYEMFPFDNAVYVYSISYADLLVLLEYSLTSGGGGLLSQMTGIDCHYTSQNKVQKLVKDGVAIYQNGLWAGDWASRTLTLALGEYLATTEQTDYITGKPNPLVEWNNTSRLLHHELQDNENAVRVLKAEAAASGGLLFIDTRAHYLLVE